MPDNKSVLVCGEWRKELTPHLVHRVVELGLGLKCDGCSTESEHIYHALMGPIEPEEQLHFVNEILKEPLN